MEFPDADGTERTLDATPLPSLMVADFVDALRQVGLGVPLGATINFAHALTAVGMQDASKVYWAGRSTLIWKPEDVDRFDQAFEAFWLGRHGGPSPLVTAPVTSSADAAAPEDSASGADQGPDGTSDLLCYSRLEVLRNKDFAACSPDELDELFRLMRDMRVDLDEHRSRRWRSSNRLHGSLDLRRTVRDAVARDGEVVRRRYRQKATRPRRLVLLCDISGSMEIYARFLLRFMHVAVAGSRHVEAFALGTRLTRLTRHLTTLDPDGALAAAGAAVPDWSGGTRLGEGVRAFNDGYGARGLARGATVVILSDGWDRGDPAQLAAEMARLGRISRRTIWVNPLKATPEYAPLARGMAAALPYVDEFVEGHSLASLASLASLIREGRPVP